MLGLFLFFLFAGIVFILFFVIMPIQSKQEGEKYEKEIKREQITDLVKNYSYGYMVYADRYPLWREEDFIKHKEEIKALHQRLKADLERKLAEEKVEKEAARKKRLG